MSQLRQDPLTRDWVIVNPERARRPHNDKRTSREACPFCRAHEADTPPEIDRISSGGDWTVRVIPNKYPALEADAGLETVSGGGRLTPGFGFHEVIVETPQHEATLATLPVAQLRLVLEMYLRRSVVLAARHPDIRQVVLFRNQGRSAGTSLGHPHSQIVATPVVSPAVRRRVMDEIACFDATGRCGSCEMLERELAAGVRVVHESAAFVTVAPFASRSAYALQVVPRRHCASFLEADAALLDDLAAHLHGVAAALEGELGDPHYNLVVLSPPVDQVHVHANHWLIELVPRLTTPAGFELGARITVNVVPPERVASELRARLARS